MRIQFVTLTGADDSVEPSRLYDLSATFPWVEWGILHSANVGRPRYPSEHWLTELAAVKYFVGSEMNLAAHLCGLYVKRVLDFGITEGADPFFDRVQLNLSRSRLRSLLQGELPKYSRPLILGGNYGGIDSFDTHEDTVFPLFDASGGRGKLGKKWPKPFMQAPVVQQERLRTRNAATRVQIPPGALEPAFCGYAGGLGPENLAEQLKKIEDVVGDATIWIDMESSLRTDERFDLNKCEAVLRTAENWI